MLDSCTIVIRKPLGHEYAVLGVRAAWAMLSNGGLEIRIVLLGDGVYSGLAKEGYIKNMLERFIEEDGAVYAVEEDLAERGLDAANLPQGVQVIASADVSELALDADSVMTF